ncbi:MAG: GvpL/GvpF family gas vesicle protein [Acidobacteriota bacterium]
MEADRSVGADSCLYLYGVFRPPPGVEADLFSELAGVEGAPDIFTVECEDLAAAVSPVPRSVYNQESLDLHAPEIEWIAARAARHEQVVRRLMQFRDIIPLKFATLYSSVERVRDMLRQQHEELARVLDHVAGREEWGVKVYADAVQVGQALERSEADVEALDRQIAAASAGQAYFLGKKKQKLVADAARQWAAEVSETVYASLLPAVVEARRTRFLNPGPSPADLPVLSAAVLVERQEVAALKAEAERLEAGYREYGMRVELSGPWAPYNFCGER